MTHKQKRTYTQQQQNRKQIHRPHTNHNKTESKHTNKQRKHKHKNIDKKGHITSEKDQHTKQDTGKQRKQQKHQTIETNRHNK